jgi:hypothetical protein
MCLVLVVVSSDPCLKGHQTVECSRDTLLPSHIKSRPVDTLCGSYSLSAYFHISKGPDTSQQSQGQLVHASRVKPYSC